MLYTSVFQPNLANIRYLYGLWYTSLCYYKASAAMTSKSSLSYTARAEHHDNPIAVKLFQIAEAKKSNVVISADLTTTDELLEIADSI